MKSLANVRHLLVDLDGTLLGAREFKLQMDFIYRTILGFKAHGGVRSAYKALTTLKREMAIAPLEYIEEITNEKRAAQIYSRVSGLPVDQAEAVLAKTIPAFFPSLKKYFYPVVEAKKFLDWGRDHFPMTLATDPVWPLELVKLRLEWAEVNPDIFGLITHAGIMHACKPTPEYYRETLKKAGMKAEECLLIGNDLKMDVPATQVGIPVYIRSREPLSPITTAPGAAPAWRGSWQTLRSILTDVLNARAQSPRIG